MFASKSKSNMWTDCGDDYYYGRDGEVADYEMALIFYRKAAEKNHPRACYMVGVCLENGHSVDKDTATEWYERAALLGDENAKKRLAKSKMPQEEESPVIARYYQMETENKEFWARYVADQKGLETLLKTMSISVGDKARTHRELAQALKTKRKSEPAENGDYAALTLALLTIKAKLGGAALFNGETVRAYLTDFLPNIREMRRLSALVFDTDALGCLRDEPEKAMQMLMARGLSEYEAERLIDCFAAAFAVTVDYGGLTNDSLLAAADCGDAEAMYLLACRCYEDGEDEELCRQYLQKAIDLRHGPAQGLMEMLTMVADGE